MPENERQQTLKQRAAERRAEELQAELLDSPPDTCVRGVFSGVLLAATIVAVNGLLAIALVLLATPTSRWRAATAPKPPADVEIELGHYKIKSGQLGNAGSTEPGTVRVVEFGLAGIVHGTDSEVIVLEDALSNYQARIKQLVGSAVRSASHGDLADPDLEAIRGRILEDVNLLLNGKSLTHLIIADWHSFQMPNVVDF